MTSCSKVGRVALAILLSLSPSLALGYAVSMGSPTANQRFAKGANLATAGAIIWTDNSSAPNPPWVMEPRPTACVILLVNLTTGLTDDSANATISNINTPAAPNYVGSEDYSGTVTIPQNTTATNYNVTARPLSFGQPIVLVGGAVLEKTVTIQVQ